MIHDLHMNFLNLKTMFEKRKEQIFDSNQNQLHEGDYFLVGDYLFKIVELP